MTRGQRRIIVILAIADLAVILGLVALMTHLAHSTATPLSTTGRTPATALNTPPNPADKACRWQAAQQMARAGLSGGVTLRADTLHLEITTALAPGQTTDDAAQLIWTAFDVALALGEECAFTQIEVTIRIQDSTMSLHASVAAADLVAYGAGALTEDEFVARVTYTVDGR